MLLVVKLVTYHVGLSKPKEAESQRAGRPGTAEATVDLIMHIAKEIPRMGI